MQLTKGQQWYQTYLTSDDWQKTKKKVLKKQPYICSIGWCGNAINLHFHHIDYAHIGSAGEIEDLKIVCSLHHYLCHHEMFRKLPLQRKYLLKRYMYLRKAIWRRFRPSWLFDWVYQAYRIR